MGNEFYILIPTYNRSATILECVYSSLNQTYEQTITVVVDNDSSDDTLSILRSKFSQEINIGKLIILTNETNVGMIGNWNLCLKNINGYAWKLLFSDDYLHPKYVETVMREFKRFDNVNIVSTSLVYFDNRGKFGKTRRYGKGIKSMKNSLLRTLATRNAIGAPSNVSFRNLQNTTISFIDNPVAADMQFFIEYCDINSRISYINKPYAFFRYEGDSVTNDLKYKIDWIDQNIEVREQLADYFNGFLKVILKFSNQVYYSLVAIHQIRVFPERRREIQSLFKKRKLPVAQFFIKLYTSLSL